MNKLHLYLNQVVRLFLALLLLFSFAYCNEKKTVTIYDKHIKDFNYKSPHDMGDEYVKTDFVNLSGRFVMPVLVYDRYKVKFDDEIYSRLPHEFKAFSEDDFKSVGIVIQLDYSRIDAGKYSDGAQAFVVACELLIYDIGNKTYAVESFVGDPPPESRMSKSGGGIPIPKERIMEYIMKLIKN